MTHDDTRTSLRYAVALCGALAAAGPIGCDARRPPAEDPGAVGSGQHRREAGRVVGITLDEPRAGAGLNGVYSDGERSLRFETVRQPLEAGAAQPPLDRRHYIALRVTDSTGRTLLTLSEDKLPSAWLREAQPTPGRERPVDPETFRLAREAAKAVEQLKLPRDLEPERSLLAQQLSLLGAHSSPPAPRSPPDGRRGP